VAEPPKIAIIDDDAEVRQATENLLKSFGFNVRAFPSGQAFLASGIAGCIACLVTDLQMPGLSGLDVMAELAHRGAATPTIVVTAFPDERLRGACEARGAIAFLHKPFDGDVLVRHLQRALGA
jgi:FixJ family two-component response regulator